MTRSTATPPHPSFDRWMPEDSSSQPNQSSYLAHLERTLTMQHAHPNNPSPHDNASDSLTQRAEQQPHYPHQNAPTLGASSAHHTPVQHQHQHQHHEPSPPPQDIPPQHVGMRSLSGDGVISDRQLERLVSRVGNKLLSTIQNEEFLNKFLNTRELLEDNKTLASQVQQLLREKKQLEAELAHTQSEVGTFKRIVGNIFLKMD